MHCLQIVLVQEHGAIPVSTSYGEMQANYARLMQQNVGHQQ